METLIEQGEFVAVFDFCLAEVANQLHGSVVTAGVSRLEAAGRRGIPQLVAPGASDMVDLQSWLPVPAQYASRPYHAHNRLIGSVGTLCEERRATARQISAKLARSTGPTAFLLPRHGIHAWDRVGQPMHEPTVHAAFADEFRRHIKPPTELHDLELHINDEAFLDLALSIFDQWVDEGRVPRAQMPA
jgi:uncharacterized protein (UPF0261 family)